MQPRVFVSHASEDKDRFVTSFAERLRQNGIDAWLDKWEMLLSGYPWLEREDILACLAYAHRVVEHERIEPLLLEAA